MRVADVMTEDVLVVDEELPVRIAALLLLHHEIGGAPVVDVEGELIGVVSEADLLAKEIFPPQGCGKAADTARRRWSAVTVGELCSRPARTTAPDVSLHDAAQMMREEGIARLVVVAGSRIVGIITRYDILKALAAPT
jgi:CBS domain-containing protein